MADNLSRIEAQLTDEEYSGPYLSRIERILKDLEPGGGGGIAFDGPYDSLEDLPATGETGIIYLVSTGETEPNYFDEYFWDTTNRRYEFLGSTEIDLSNYATKEDLTDATTATVTGENISLGI